MGIAKLPLAKTLDELQIADTPANQQLVRDLHEAAFVASHLLGSAPQRDPAHYDVLVTTLISP